MILKLFLFFTMVSLRFRCPLGHFKEIALILDYTKAWLPLIMKNWDEVAVKEKSNPRVMCNCAFS